jgi:hypothetical protein
VLSRQFDSADEPHTARGSRQSSPCDGDNVLHTPLDPAVRRLAAYGQPLLLTWLSLAKVLNCSCGWAMEEWPGFGHPTMLLFTARHSDVAVAHHKLSQTTKRHRLDAPICQFASVCQSVCHRLRQHIPSDRSDTREASMLPWHVLPSHRQTAVVARYTSRDN